MERITRDRKLTPEEIEHFEEVREKIEKEFPPDPDEYLTEKELDDIARSVVG
jgi:hypothetical protein